MKNPEIISIIIYVLAGVLTVLLFRRWRDNKTPAKTIARYLLWIVLAAVVLIAAGVVFEFATSPQLEVSWHNILHAVYGIASLPMFSFAYFMIFIGVIFILRDRRRHKLKNGEYKSKSNKKS